MDIKELIERVKLTPEVNPYNGEAIKLKKGLVLEGQLLTRQEIFEAGAQAQLNKVLNDQSFALAEWVDIPTKRGEYWMSPFIDGKYIAPRILSIIDYERPDRGLEVQYDFPHDTIPVKTFAEEYYPNAKWMLIKTPVIPLREAMKEVNND